VPFKKISKLSGGPEKGKGKRTLLSRVNLGEIAAFCVSVSWAIINQPYLLMPLAFNGAF